MRFSIEAEQCVVGGLLLDPNRTDDVLEICTPDDFYSADNRAIFRHIVKIYQAGKVADVITVSESMSDAGALEPAGGLGYLVELANNTPSAANVRAYATIVADRAIERRITDSGQRIAELGDDEGLAVDDKLERIHSELAGLERKEKQGDVKALDKILKARIEVLDLKHRGKFPEGIKTGFTEIDNRFGWLNPGDMWVVGGRPGQGKTAFALNVCTNIATAGFDVLIFSLEMTEDSLGDRQIAAAAGINNKLIRNGQLQNGDWDKLAVGMHKLKGLPIEICDTPGIDISRLKVIARSRAKSKKLGLIMIDYLQLVNDKRKDKTLDVVSSVSRQIKEIAKLCECPVMALAQLNRSVEQRSNKRPMIADLRESGQIEQDADMISFLYRDDYYYEDSPNKGMVEVISAKVREGETGTDILGTELQYCRFVNLSSTHYQENWQEQQRPKGRQSFD